MNIWVHVVVAQPVELSKEAQITFTFTIGVQPVPIANLSVPLPLCATNSTYTHAFKLLKLHVWSVAPVSVTFWLFAVLASKVNVAELTEPISLNGVSTCHSKIVFSVNVFSAVNVLLSEASQVGQIGQVGPSGQVGHSAQSAPSAPSAQGTPVGPSGHVGQTHTAQSLYCLYAIDETREEAVTTSAKHTHSFAAISPNVVVYVITFVLGI